MVVGSPSLKVFHNFGDVALWDVCWVDTVGWVGIKLGDLRGISSLYNSVIL